MKLVAFAILLSTAVGTRAASATSVSGAQGHATAEQREHAVELATPSARQELRELWLRFHELELCQGLDTVFALYPKRMEIWCRIEDERSYQRLAEIVQDVSHGLEVDVYVTRPPTEKKTLEELDPPPSLWNNAELRGYFQDPFSRDTTLSELTTRPPAEAPRVFDPLLKRRMMLFAEQILEWNNKMKRYAEDLPALAAAGFGSDRERNLKSRAATVCLAHAVAAGRYAEKLAEVLKQALPRPTKSSRIPKEFDKARKQSSPEKSAEQLSKLTLNVARRIYEFIYPRNYTVGLDDLREPSLLESLRMVRELVSSFQKLARAK